MPITEEEAKGSRAAMTENNKARGRAALFHRNLSIPPLTKCEVQASISPDDIDVWLAAHCSDGLYARGDYRCLLRRTWSPSGGRACWMAAIVPVRRR